MSKTMGETAVVVAAESGVGTALTPRARREEKMKVVKCMLGFWFGYLENVMKTKKKEKKRRKGIKRNRKKTEDAV